QVLLNAIRRGPVPVSGATVRGVAGGVRPGLGLARLQIELRLRLRALPLLGGIGRGGAGPRLARRLAFAALLAAAIALGLLVGIAQLRIDGVDGGLLVRFVAPPLFLLDRIGTLLDRGFALLGLPFGHGLECVGLLFGAERVVVPDALGLAHRQPV